jgi:hypothetical protein
LAFGFDNLPNRLFELSPANRVKPKTHTSS